MFYKTMWKKIYKLFDIIYNSSVKNTPKYKDNYTCLLLSRLKDNSLVLIN